MRTRPAASMIDGDPIEGASDEARATLKPHDLMASGAGSTQAIFYGDAGAVGKHTRWQPSEYTP